MAKKKEKKEKKKKKKKEADGWPAMKMQKRVT